IIKLDSLQFIFYGRGSVFPNNNNNSCSFHPVPFMSGISTLLYAGIDKIYWGVMLGHIGSGGLKALFCLVLPVVDPCLSLLERFLVLVVPLRSFNFGGGVLPCL
ncbi:hypothetical protein A2U01_0046683, partial [Trifolium medium]|nr:hypothetical protein [Trifolium medium]